MKAAVFHRVGDLRVDADYPDPEPGRNDVLLRVAACGICGTDRHIMHGEFTAAPPVIIGHECSGEVLAVGDGVTTLAPGDRVAIDPNMPCGLCRPCRRGQIHLCQNLRALGVDVDGGFAELMVAPEQQCFRLLDQVTLEEGAMAEPVACCMRGIDRAGIAPGDRVAVIGGGAIGQILAQLARAAGASWLVLSDPVAERRQMALELGADAVVDPLSEDQLAPGGALEGGADVVLEAVGSVPTTGQAVDWAAEGGTIVWFGVTPPGKKVAIEPNLVFRKELTIRGARINPFTHARAIAAMAAGQVKVALLLSRRIPLEELAAVLEEPAGADIKTLVIPR
ncbi:MAG: zinc-dependent alcohol dehydrogenase family protein [Anaerolineae bacterium]